MRAVVQRVSKAKVSIGNQTKGEIGIGLVVFLGVGKDDSEDDAKYLASKISGLRIFEDSSGLMNLSVLDIGGAVLAISQFTLYADCRKGRRPGFSAAAGPEEAEKLYDYFCAQLHQEGLKTATGQFQADMKINVDNDGPVTILLDSRKLF